jgi:hypothetical protein
MQECGRLTHVTQRKQCTGHYTFTPWCMPIAPRRIATYIEEFPLKLPSLPNDHLAYQWLSQNTIESIDYYSINTI